MPEVVVPVDWVQQEETFYCGPAVAEMTLRALRANGPAPPASWQDALWNEIKHETRATRPPSAGSGSPSNPPFPSQKCFKCSSGDRDWQCWTTTPTALARVLNMDQSAATFKVRKFDQESGATAVLMAGLDQGIPGIALVFGWRHWLVVDGYTHDEPGSCMTMAGRALNSVYVRDPEQTASIHLVTCDAWRGDYLSFVPCGEFGDKIVVIGGTLTVVPPAPKPPVVPVLEPSVADSPIQQYRPPIVRKGEIVTPGLALETAEKAASDLRALPRWQPALSDSKPQSPLLVQRLDRDDSYYYIVEHVKGSLVTARLIVDANSNRFTEASGIERTGDELPHYVDPAVILKNWQGKPIALPSLRSRVVRPGMVGEHPVLVWRPCRESVSPFAPFYLRSVGDEFVYVRVDGSEFTRLTDGPV